MCAIWYAGVSSVLLLLLSGPVQAQTVEVTGRAVIEISVNQAREDALTDALRQAGLTAGASIRSTQRLSAGQLEQDDMDIRSRARVHNIEVLGEGQHNGIYELEIRAEVRPEAMCSTSQQSYRKAIAVAGFGLAQPSQATLGRLQNIEQDLPRVLISELNNSRFVQALDASRISLYEDPRRAPSMETSQQRLTTSVALATRLGAQYVVSGVVRQLGQGNPGKQTEPEPQAGWRSLLGLDRATPEREFVADLFVHDGLSGALLFQRTYQGSGAWTPERNASVGFASPVFWDTPYGKEVGHILEAMVDDIGEVIRCQPFMARIVAARGKRIHIEASGGTGIRPGDKFQVYRTGTFYNLDLEPRTELTDMATEVVIKQVQPQFVVAEMTSDAASLAIQRDDLVIAW